MDLLGDLGTEDQLTSARAEIAVLTQKVKDLSFRVKELTVENQTLLAEVEIYRKEAAMPTFSSLALGKQSMSIDMKEDDDDEDVFVKSGNGIYPTEAAVTLSRLHESSNPLCCALNHDDTLLATGGADGNVNLTFWGPALAPTPDAAQGVVHKATRVPCGAPVICTAFSNNNDVVAAGCMDGSIHWIRYDRTSTNGLASHVVQAATAIRVPAHSKYIKSMEFCPGGPSYLLATAGADGNVTLSKLKEDHSTEQVQSLHFSAPVESLCFSEDGTKLYTYTRDTPYLSCFDLQRECEQSKIRLNTSGVNGGFEDHVSFVVLDMAVSPNNGGKYLALATDTSRNIVLDSSSGKQIRNLYGHTNDGFSQPKIGWSSSGQYLYGNTQEDSSVCVWDVASSSIVRRLNEAEGGHTQPIRDLYSSRTTDTLVTTSFDKNTKIWLQAM